MIKLKNNIEDLLDSLSKSKFRGSFHLNKKMKNYVKEKGFDKIKSDARDLITSMYLQHNQFLHLKVYVPFLYHEFSLNNLYNNNL